MLLSYLCLTVLDVKDIFNLVLRLCYWLQFHFPSHLVQTVVGQTAAGFHSAVDSGNQDFCDILLYCILPSSAHFDTLWEVFLQLPFLTFSTNSWWVHDGNLCLVSLTSYVWHLRFGTWPSRSDQNTLKKGGSLKITMLMVWVFTQCLKIFTLLVYEKLSSACWKMQLDANQCNFLWTLSVTTGKSRQAPLSTLGSTNA